MERSVRTPKLAKDRVQKETHSEIERKRRERMKIETEFLHRQVPYFQCKDKLSIFLAGAERLISYTEKLGKREYILNDEEYSQIIINNINAFAICVRCSDGMILRQQNAQKFFGVSESAFVGNTLYDMAEPSSDTKKTITTNLTMLESELQRVRVGDLVPRNFVIGLHCEVRAALKNCVYGLDNKTYRFIEFCGDLVDQSDDSDPCTVFRGLCRPLDPACCKAFNSHQMSTSTDSTGNHFQVSDNCLIPPTASSNEHVSLRLSGTDFSITEVVGNVSTILGWSAQDLLRKHLEDFVPALEKNTIKRAVYDATRTDGLSSTVPIYWFNPLLNKVVELTLCLDAVSINTKSIYCVVCRLFNARTKTLANDSINSEDCLISTTLSTNDTSTWHGYDHQDEMWRTPTFTLPNEEVSDRGYADSETVNSDVSVNGELTLTSKDGVPDPNEDWRQLPCNSSFSNLLSGAQLPDLFHPDYLKDLLKEDVTDL